MMPGPDFPGGGQIISAGRRDRASLRSGRGSHQGARALEGFEELARGQWQVVVDELPPGTSSQKVLEEIEELTNPKVKAGKKSLTPEQCRLKQLVLSVLDTVRDESGKEAAVRLVFEPRTSKVGPRRVHAEHPAGAHQPGVERPDQPGDDRPRRPAAPEDRWPRSCASGSSSASRPCGAARSFRLGKVDDRIHILEGRQLVLLNIDKVIKIIRNSDEPKPELMKAFKLRPAGRGHPRDPAAAAGAARRHQDREGAERAARGAGRAREAARQRRRDAQAGRQGDRRADAKKYGDARRTHDRGGASARRSRSGDRRAGDRHRLGNGLGARAQRPRPRPVAVHLQEGDGCTALSRCARSTSCSPSPPTAACIRCRWRAARRRAATACR